MLKLRAFVLVALGTPVMAGLLVGIVALPIRLWGTSLLDTGHWLGSAVFGSLSLVALGLILRVRRRVVEEDERGPLAHLARAAPILMVGGAIAGGVFAHHIAESALANHAAVMALECRAYLGDDQPIDACLPVMDACDAEVRGTDGLKTNRQGQLSVDWPDGLPVPDDPKDRARHLCAWRTLGDPPGR